ncbi:MAG: DUF4954 domain-containing protein, partial [Chitinophagaceae bacterium]
IAGWDEIHEYYNRQSKKYPAEKFQHAWASMLEVLKTTPKKFTKKMFAQLLEQAAATNSRITKAIFESREKDYKNPFRRMVYDNQQEMDTVIGALKDNSFILQQQQESQTFLQTIGNIRSRLSV